MMRWNHDFLGFGADGLKWLEPTILFGYFASKVSLNILRAGENQAENHQSVFTPRLVAGCATNSRTDGQPEFSLRSRRDAHLKLQTKKNFFTTKKEARVPVMSWTLTKKEYPRKIWNIAERLGKSTRIYYAGVRREQFGAMGIHIPHTFPIGHGEPSTYDLSFPTTWYSRCELYSHYIPIYGKIFIKHLMENPERHPGTTWRNVDVLGHLRPSRPAAGPTFRCFQRRRRPPRRKSTAASRSPPRSGAVAKRRLETGPWMPWGRRRSKSPQIW